jgi:hypothetical protein
MKLNPRSTSAALLVLLFASGLAVAQGDNPADDAKVAESPAHSKTVNADKPSDAQTKVAAYQAPASKQPPQAYSLSISVKESDAGKDAVVKNYALTVVSDDDRGGGIVSVRDGDRIPYMGDKGREYHNVGTNIDVNRATRLGDFLVINLRANDTSLAAKSNGVDLPFEHDWNIQVTAALVPGKPEVIYAAADGVTGHKVDIEATAQLLSPR